MALQVVGSGLGRTGTFSMKLALEKLGFGPCHHMVEVFGHPESVPLWIAAGEGRGDWDAIFKDYRSMTDYPGCAYWRELAAHYPDAKVLHTTRDADGWFDSTQATIFAPGSLVDNPPSPEMAAFFASFAGHFGGRLHDRDFMVDYFHRHDEEVKRAIPAERLLVWHVGDGWAPLCEFLGVPLPDEDYPRENTRQQFVDRVQAQRAASGAQGGTQA